MDIRLPTHAAHPARHAAWLLAGALALALPGAAAAVERTATPSTLASVFAAAQGGDTVVLAAGSYGVFRGGTKTGVVTLRPQSGAAVTMQVDYNPSSGIAIEGVTMTGAHIMGVSRNLTFTNVRFTSQVTVRDATGPMTLLFDRCTWGAIDSTGYYEGRLSTLGSISGPCGITVQSCTFGPGGNLDGIQTGADGLRILDCEFVGIRSGGSGIHTDAIQLYGSRNTVVRGNWIHDCDSGIMAPDGTYRELIEDNIIDIGYPYAIMIGSDDGSIIRHNTLLARDVDFYGPNSSGIVILGSKSGQPAGRGTVVQDNIVHRVEVQSGLATTAVNDWNLVRAAGGLRGPHDIAGVATFVGGSAPTTWAGFRLAAGSKGKNAASDGLDMGVRRFGPGPVTPDTMAPSVPASLTATTVSSSRIDLAWSAATDNVGVTGYRVARGGAVIATVSGTTYADTGLAASTTYGYTVTALDAAGNASASSTSRSATTQAATAATTLLTTQTPAIAAASDGGGTNYELGMRFTSTSAGRITAVRFWKSANESGAHVGRIWSVSGTLLASVTFTGESASGWQQQALATPLTIAANTEYLVSVNTGGTWYVATTGGLATQIANGSLRSVVGSNGRFGAPGAFPMQSWESSNYFRDVVFTADGATTGPALTGGDIGAVAAAGSSSQAGGVWTVRGSGADIWGTLDEFHFARLPVSGDVRITARVDGLTGTDGWAKAGVMIRESTAAGARHAFACATPGNGVAYQRRTVAGGSSAHTAGPLRPAPMWVRLERIGSTITASSSIDGVAWQVIRTETLALPATALVGLAVTSHRDGTLCTATFSQVTVVSAPSASN